MPTVFEFPTSLWIYECMHIIFIIIFPFCLLVDIFAGLLRNSSVKWQGIARHFSKGFHANPGNILSTNKIRKIALAVFKSFYHTIQKDF